MVGFGGKFATQMVPEWRKKYVRYGHLATLMDKLPTIDGDSPSGSFDAETDGHCERNAVEKGHRKACNGEHPVKLIEMKNDKAHDGRSIIIPAHCQNTIKAKKRFKMLSTIIKSGYE